jgi:hypothetical protein
VPPALRTISLPDQPMARQAAAHLAQSWRDSRALAEDYVGWAGRIQRELALGGEPLDPAALGNSETFLFGEQRLQEATEAALLDGATRALEQLARARRQGFWSGQQPEVKTRWTLVANAAHLLNEANRVEAALKGKVWKAEDLLGRYAYGDAPWCELDAAHRRLERDAHYFDFHPEQHDRLLRLVARARHRHKAVATDLSSRFIEAYAGQGFELPSILPQSDVYHEVVAPLVEQAQVAYVLVDSLRFEMARDLCALLEEDWSHQLAGALATVPTITEVGMAALMPGAENGVSLATTRSGKLVVSVDGRTLRSRQERVQHFTAQVPMSTAITLDRLAPLSDKRVEKQLQEARVVLVTATDDIDRLAENVPSLARRMMDDVLNQLRRAIKTLLGLGFETVVITADHGHLFGEGLSSGEGIEAPGGQTVVLKRRVWLGKGGANHDGVLRAPLSAFAIGGDLELATPRSLSVFRVQGGSLEYFHGGLSLPELVIPVLTVQREKSPSAEAGSAVQWALALNSASGKITSRFLSVTITGSLQELLLGKLPALRVEVQAGGRPISVPVGGGDAFDESTGDVQPALNEAGEVEPIVVTLQLTEVPAEVTQVALHLLDATTGASLTRLEDVPIAVRL